MITSVGHDNTSIKLMLTKVWNKDENF